MTTTVNVSDRHPFRPWHLFAAEYPSLTHAHTQASSTPRSLPHALSCNDRLPRL